MLNKTIQLYIKSFAGLSRDIWFLSLVTLINRSGTMVIPFLTLYLTTERQFTLTEAGWVMACFGIGSLLGTMIGGRLTDKIGHYPVILFSLFFGGMVLFVLQQVHSLYAICAVIFVFTTISDSFRPASMASVAVYSTPENRTRSISLVRLAINLGFALGPALGGLIAANIGYDWLFWIDGTTCMAAAVFFGLTIKNQKAEPTEEEIKEVKEANGKSPYQDRSFLFFFVLLFLSASAFVLFFSAVPIYFRQTLLMDEAQIGGLLALNGFIIFAVEMPLVYLLQDKIPHLKLVAIGIGLIGLSYLIFNIFFGWFFAALLALLAITFGEILNIPFANTFALSRSNASNRGKYMALYGNAYSLAHVLSPFIGLRVAEIYGFDALWYLLAFICALSMLGFMFLQKQVAAE